MTKLSQISKSLRAYVHTYVHTLKLLLSQNLTSISISVIPLYKHKEITEKMFWIPADLNKSQFTHEETALLLKFCDAMQVCVPLLIQSPELGTTCNNLAIFDLAQFVGIIVTECSCFFFSWICPCWKFLMTHALPRRLLADCFALDDSTTAASAAREDFFHPKKLNVF
jgi:hypothetical protein